jgi:D-alanine-D-alanine ligase
MRVAILHNARPEICPEGLPDDAFEEYDTPETIAAIGDALGRDGMDAIGVPADAQFPSKLRDGGFDFVFNIAEGAGRRCREAVPAAICEFLGIPFTGSDALTLAATLDKAVARRIVSPEVPVARAVLVMDEQDEERLRELPYPAVVKPNDEGSSKGIRHGSLCGDADAAADRSRWLRERYGCPVLVEQYLPGVEVTVGIMGNGRAAEVIASMEIAPASEGTGNPFLYSVEVKRDFRNSVRYYTPPRLSTECTRVLRSHALTAYRLLGCRDVARMDFRLDADGRPRFLECNPLPGLNPHSSDLVILSRDVLAYDKLIRRILHEAIARWRKDPNTWHNSHLLRASAQS